MIDSGGQLLYCGGLVPPFFLDPDMSDDIELNDPEDSPYEYAASDLVWMDGTTRVYAVQDARDGQDGPEYTLNGVEGWIAESRLEPVDLTKSKGPVTMRVTLDSDETMTEEELEAKGQELLEAVRGIIAASGGDPESVKLVGIKQIDD